MRRGWLLALVVLLAGGSPDGLGGRSQAAGGGWQDGEEAAVSAAAARKLAASEAMERGEESVAHFLRLQDEVQERGEVAVIVRLRVAFSVESELKGRAEARAQRMVIGRVREQLLDEVAGYDVNSVKRFEYLPYVAMRVSAGGLEALRESPRVLDIEEDLLLQATLAQSVPLIGGTNLWASGYTGTNQVVAILDTGVDKTHSFLANKVVSEACYSTNVPAAGGTSTCPGGVTATTAVDSGMPCSVPGDCSHGTHVAGIAAGKGTTYSGVAKDAQLIAIQVFTRFDGTTNCRGAASCTSAYTSDIIKGLQRVYELRTSFSIASANLSLGGGSFTANCDSSQSSTKSVIDLLRGAGIATVIASGNESKTNAISAPACISTAVSVGSVSDTTSTVSSFSNSSSFLSLLAPGQGITSSIPGNAYATWNGTSMATPHVAGAWALLKQKEPTATVTAVLSALTTTGQPITDSRNGIIKPLIKVDLAANALGGGSTTPTVPAVPTGLTATAASSSQINLAWTDASTDETGFRVRRRTSPTGTWTVLGTVAAGVTSYQNTGLSAGTTYYFSVASFNTAGESSLSTQASATTQPAAGPTAPTGLTAVATSATQINLSWTDNSTSETGFRISRRTGSSTTWSVLGTVTQNVTSFQNTGLTAGTTYVYRVTAYNATAESTPSNEATATTLSPGPTAPTGLTATVASSTQINLAWTDNSTDETGFRISRKIGTNGVWAVLGTVGQGVVAYQDTGLAAGTTYVYRVTSYNANGDSAPSNEATATTTVSPPAAPTGLTAVAASATQVNLAWTDNSNNETGFRVSRRTGSSTTWAVIATVTQNVTTFQNTGLTAGVTYAYRVTAFNNGAESTPSNEVSVTTPSAAPASPTSLAGVPVSTTQINLTWVDNSTNETGFRLSRKTGSSGTWAVLATTGQNVITYQDTGLTPGTTYVYRVTAYNSTGESSASNEVTLTTQATTLTAPSSLTAVAASTSQVRLAWVDNTASETGFRVWRRPASSATWAVAGTVSQNVITYQDTGLLPGTAYVYRVTAFNATGESTFSNEVTVTTLAAPASPSGLAAAALSDTQVRLTWTDNSNDETGFRVYRKTGSTGTWALIGTVGSNVTAAQNTALIPATTYVYRLTAYNTNGESVASNEATVTTLASGGGTAPTAPTGLQATAASTTSVQLVWVDNSNNETEFQIERRTGNSSNWVPITRVAANINTFTNTGLNTGTTYTYRVSALNGTVVSSLSNSVSVVTPSLPFTSLTNGQSVSGTVVRYERKYYKLYVPAGATSLTVTTTGTGDADLFIRRSLQPTTNTYACLSDSETSSEVCTITNPTAGDWHIMIYGYEATSGFTLSATYPGGTGTMMPLAFDATSEGNGIRRSMPAGEDLFVEEPQPAERRKAGLPQD